MIRFPRWFCCLVLAIGLITAMPARAQAPAPVDDEITLELSAETYVETATANVSIGFDLAQTAGGLGDQRDKLRQILVGLDDKATWRFLRFDRSVDPAGLERWRVLASGRLPEKSLSGLADKARSASKPGLQVRIAGIDFSPTVAEREASAAGLRAELYAQVQAEIDRLKKALPGRNFRVKRITFHDDDQPVMPKAMMAMQAPQLRQEAVSSDSDGETQPAVARRLGLAATVVVGAFAEPAATPRP